MKALLVLLCLLTAGFAAVPFTPNNLPAEAVAAFKTGTKFILFSLEPPSGRGFNAPQPKPEESHHGFKILGSTELVDAPSRASAVAAITNAVRNYTGISAPCFEPRHSLRVITPSGIIYDFVACFECSGIQVFRGNDSIGGVGLSGSQEPLDDLLIKAKIPLAKTPSPK